VKERKRMFSSGKTCSSTVEFPQIFINHGVWLSLDCPRKIHSNTEGGGGKNHPTKQCLTLLIPINVYWIENSELNSIQQLSLYPDSFNVSMKLTHCRWSVYFSMFETQLVLGFFLPYPTEGGESVSMLQRALVHLLCSLL
jgi:hypothetical protein